MSKILLFVSGFYSFVFSSLIVVSGIKNGVSATTILLLSVPLYFIIFFVALTYRQTRLYHRLNPQFVIKTYVRTSDAFNLGFLFSQTSLIFLLTTLLLSAAIGGTIISVLLK